MGLDSVELVLAVEEEFALSFPHDDMSQIVTVGDIFEYLKKNLGTKPTPGCPSQKVFHRVRSALMANYGIERRLIQLDSRLSDLKSSSELKEGWPYLQLFADLQMPEYALKWGWLFLPQTSTDALTVREVVLAMLILNEDDLSIEPNTNDDIWIRLVKVINRQTNAPIHEIRPNAGIVKDLGVD